MFSNSWKFACWFFTSTLATRYLCCLFYLCCNCIPQEISSLESLILLCSLLARCSGIFCLESEPSQKLFKSLWAFRLTADCD